MKRSQVVLKNARLRAAYDKWAEKLAKAKAAIAQVALVGRPSGSSDRKNKRRHPLEMDEEEANDDDESTDHGTRPAVGSSKGLLCDKCNPLEGTRYDAVPRSTRFACETNPPQCMPSCSMCVLGIIVVCST